jgi:V8-like Glu-specific endopeptidase
MTKLFAICLLLLTFSIPLISSNYPKSSLIPLTNASGDSFCTAFSINQQKHFYATAAHCVDSTEPDLPIPHLMSQRSVTVMMQKDLDLAVIRGPFGRPALRLADIDPNVGDDVNLLGYPLGSMDVVIYSGTIVSRRATDHRGQFFTVFFCLAAPGDSGGPVLNLDGQVISIVQVGWGLTGMWTGGATLDMLRKALGPYLE